jgi:hypothetical protein
MLFCQKSIYIKFNQSLLAKAVKVFRFAGTVPNPIYHPFRTARNLLRDVILGLTEIKPVADPTNKTSGQFSQTCCSFELLFRALCTEICFSLLCCGSSMFIPDPIFSVPDSGFRVDKIPDPGSASKNLSIFNPKKLILRSQT